MGVTFTVDVPAPLLTVRYIIPDAGSETYAMTATRGLRVIDAVIHKTSGAGGGANTLTVMNGGDAITDAIVTNIADTAIARAGTVDDSTQVVAVAGTLGCASVDVGNSACDVYVYCIPG